MSNVKFFVIYLFFMVLTYLWRFYFFGVAIEGGFDIENIKNSMHILMALSYAIMSYVAYRRGKIIGKGYIAAFPIVGAVFDLILVFIPLVPTVMNIITIVLGMPDNKNVQPEVTVNRKV